MIKNFWQPSTHVPCNIHSTSPNHSNSYLSPLITIISGGRYNLWSYTLGSFLRWSTPFPNPVYSLLSMSENKCHTHIYKNTTQTHTHTFIYQPECFQKTGRRSKYFEGVLSITPNEFPYIFSILLSYSLILIQNSSSSTPFQNFKVYQLGHVFYGAISPLCP